VLLLDLNLPGSQGLGTLQQVVEADLGTPIVVLSGMDETLGQAALAEGAEDYLCKSELSTALLEKTIVYARERFARTKLLETKKDVLLSLAARQQMKIADDLHDGVMQLLTTTQRRVRSLEKLLSRDRSPHVAQAAEIAEVCEQTYLSIKAAIKGIPPAQLTKLGLAGALSKLAQQANAGDCVACQFQAEPSIPVAKANVSLQLYYIAQQALQNAVQHAAASSIRISLARSNRFVVLKVADNGRGFDSIALQRQSSGWGIRSMQNRAMAIGARLSIQSAPRRGTTVQCGIAERKLLA